MSHKEGGTATLLNGKPTGVWHVVQEMKVTTGCMRVQFVTIKDRQYVLVLHENHITIYGLYDQDFRPQNSCQMKGIHKDWFDANMIRRFHNVKATGEQEQVLCGATPHLLIARFIFGGIRGSCDPTDRLLYMFQSHHTETYDAGKQSVKHFIERSARNCWRLESWIR